MKLIAYLILKAKLNTVTSLQINCKDIKDVPLIPAHLIRSKMRHVLELYYGFKQSEDVIHRCVKINCFICRIFGSENPDTGIARLSVRDGIIEEKKKPIKNTEKSNWEIKMEGNRLLYRIVPDTVFNLEFLYKIFEIKGDMGKLDLDNFSYILETFNLIENDYLGKGGARGAGKVRFSDLIIDVKPENTLLTIPEGWERGKKTDKGFEIVRTKIL